MAAKEGTESKLISNCNFERTTPRESRGVRELRRLLFKAIPICIFEDSVHKVISLCLSCFFNGRKLTVVEWVFRSHRFLFFSNFFHLLNWIMITMLNYFKRNAKANIGFVPLEWFEIEIINALNHSEQISRNFQTKPIEKIWSQYMKTIS